MGQWKNGKHHWYTEVDSPDITIIRHSGNMCCKRSRCQGHNVGGDLWMVGED